jgi:hypothetical protein
MIDTRESEHGSDWGARLLPARPLAGAAPLLERVLSEPLEEKYRRLFLELLNVVCPVRNIPAYCYQVAFFVCRLKGLASNLSEHEARFQVIDLTDFCDGLPAADTVVDIFTACYERYSSPQVKIGVAECLGRLTTGLPRSAALFHSFLSGTDLTVQKQAALAVGRVLNVQSRLAQRVEAWAMEIHVVEAANASIVGPSVADVNFTQVAVQESSKSSFFEFPCFFLASSMSIFCLRAPPALSTSKYGVPLPKRTTQASGCDEIRGKKWDVAATRQSAANK